MKKRILIVLAALTILLCVPLIANAASVDDLTFDATTGTITKCDTEAEGELVIPEEIDGVKVTSIGDLAFNWCNRLTSITIPDSVTKIGMGAFRMCDNLISVNIPNNVTSIGSSVFDSCTSLMEINIPDGVTSIGNRAFENCTSLTNINIPDSVTSIEECAFGYCTSLTNINIPDSVTSIDDMAFFSCNLNINVSPNNQNYCDIDGVLFTKDKKTIVTYAIDKLQPEYIIPNGVTSIGDYAFSDCKSLTSVQLPDGVLSIGTCAFGWCESLPNITIPDSVTTIGSAAFDGCTGLTSVDIPDSVTSINNGTFEGCTGLKSISIPDSVTNIDFYVFSHCDSLTDVYYSGTEQEWKLININNVYGGNNYLLNATIHYNSEMPVKTLEVQPVTPEVDTAANAVSFPVTVVDKTRAAELNEVELYVAEYDENGCLIGLNLGTKGAIEGDTITITADIPDAEHYKFMLWDDNNTPLMDVIYDIYTFAE